MKVVCLGYMDPAKWEAMPEEERMRKVQECLGYDEVLRKGNHVAGGSCLDAPEKAVTLRDEGGVTVTDGPFAETKEVLGGILELEVDSFEQAVELMKKHPGVNMGPFELRGTTSPLLVDDEGLSDEQQIRALIAEWARCLEAKDVAAMMTHYAEDALLFDCCPPYKTQSRAAIAEVWEKSLPYFPEKFRSEHRDLQVHVEGNCAFVHGLHRFVPEPADHPCGQSWMRVTLGYRKSCGQWKVTHEHISMPYNPMTGQMWNIKDPELLDMPDYGAELCGQGEK